VSAEAHGLTRHEPAAQLPSASPAPATPQVEAPPDRKIDRSPAGLAATGAHCGGQTTPLTRNLGRDRQRIESGLDRPKPLRANRAFVVVARDQAVQPDRSG
jgi:hypothetical protein